MRRFIARGPGIPCAAAALALLVTPADAARLPVHSYSVAEGLPHARVRRIAQDSRGFVWLATPEGLARFDGARFETYGTDSGLSSAFINDILEAREGPYWVATSRGLCRLDPDRAPVRGTGESPLPFEPVALEPGRAGPDVIRLHQDPAGALWVGTEGGLYRSASGGLEAVFDPVPLTFPSGQPPSFDVLAFADDPDGSLWIGTSHGILSRHADGRLVHRPIPTTGTLAFVRAVAADGAGRIWAGHDDGLYVFVPEREEGAIRLPGSSGAPSRRRAAAEVSAGVTEPLDLRPGEGRWVTARGLLGRTAVRRIERGTDGRIWIAQIGGGLVEFDGREFRRYTTGEGLTDETLGAIFEDAAGTLWLGTDTAGALRIAWDGPLSYDDRDGMGHTFVTSIQEGVGGSLWTTSDRFHVGRFDGSRFDTGQPPMPPGVDDVALFGHGLRDRSGAWWAPTSRGLFRFPPVDSAAAMSRSRPEPVAWAGGGLPSDRLGEMLEGRDGSLWMATLDPADPCLARKRLDSYGIEAYGSSEGLPRPCRVDAMAESPDGELWLSLQGGLLARRREGRFAVWSPGPDLEGQAIVDLHFDPAGRLWIASPGAGLGRIDRPTDERPAAILYSRRQGMPSDNVRCIADDAFGRIYAGTARGVAILDPETGGIRALTTADGLANDEVFSALRHSGGDLWFGTLDGLSRLTPEPDRDPPSAPTAWIAGVTVAGQRLPVDMLGAREISGLRLPHDRRQIQFDFFALTSVPAEPVLYQYSLGDGQDQWSPPGEERTVHFGALPPGSYRFAVRAVAAGDGHRSGTGRGPAGSPAVVSFVILPPFWRTWWFLGLAAASVVGLAVAAHRHRLARAVEVERVRTRIASDLHDDIGSLLSNIAILSEVARRQPGGSEPAASEPLQRIAGISREAVDSMSDIVWATNPARDRLGDLTLRMRRFANDMATSAGIELTVDLPDGDLRLDGETRRHIYLVFKESLSNAVRHSGCGAAEVRLRREGSGLRLTVSDDGRGFDTRGADGGHGLASMRARARGLGGDLTIRSGAGLGTEVTLELPIRRTKP